MCETKWKKRPCASVSCSSKPGLYPFIYSYSVYLSLARALSLSFLFWFYPSPANGHPPCLANQKSIKNTSTPSLESYPGWGKDRSASRMLSLSFSQAHTHTHSLSSSRDLSSRLLHSQAPPSCLLEVGNMIYEKRGRNLYIFFLVHPLIYLLDFSSCLWWRGGWD